MELNSLLALGFGLAALFMISCSDDELATQNLTLDIAGLEDLGSTAVYEGWIMVDGAPQTTGTR